MKEINPDIEILTEYHGAKNYITRRCKKCGDTRDVKPKSLVEGRECVVCAARNRQNDRRITTEQFIDNMKEVNANIEVLSEYYSREKKVLCRCLVDNNEWYAQPRMLIKGHGCPVCADKKQNRRSHDDFINDMHKKHPMINVVSEFKKVSDKVAFECSICKYKWITSPSTLLSTESKGCPKCSGHARVTEDDFINKMKLINDSLEYIDGYVNTCGYANMRCKKCGNEFSSYVSNLMNGKGCPLCNMSHGSRKIESYLKVRHIEYIREYRFKDCVYKRELPFDFYLPELNICIEYDGEQHFKPVKFAKYSDNESIDKYHLTVYRDNIKNDYCKNNGILLIRIPYTEYNNIENILNKLLP